MNDESSGVSEMAPVPVMEYGREGDLETRAGRVMWLLGGMLILSLVSSCASMVESGAAVMVSALTSADLAAYFGAGVGLAAFALLLVGLVFCASRPGRTPALLSVGRPAWVSAVVICVLMVSAVVGAFAVRAMAVQIGVGPTMRASRVQALFAAVRSLAFPIGVVVAMLVIRKR